MNNTVETKRPYVAPTLERRGLLRQVTAAKLSGAL